MIAGRQRSQRQEELGDDDQDRQRAIERDRAVHQPEADLDRHERHGDRRTPLEHERGLERGPKHLHRRVAVATAHVADGVHLLDAATEQLERRAALQDVEEECAQPAQLGEPAFGDRARPTADHGQQQDQDRPRDDEDQHRRRVHDRDRREHEQRHGDGEGSCRLGDRDVGLERLAPGDDDRGQLAAALTTGVAGAERKEVPGQVCAQPSLEPVGRALGQPVADDQQRHPPDRQQPDDREDRCDPCQGRPIEEDVGHDHARQVCRDDDYGGRHEPARDPRGEQAPRPVRAREQAALRWDRAGARAGRAGDGASSRACRRRSCPGRSSRRRPCRAARTASR